MITIIDYGMGNLRSVEKAFLRLNESVEITSDPQKISDAKKLVLPGVGHFESGMNNLSSRGLIPVLNEKVLNKKTPILGICLGMQLFTLKSDEGSAKGLGWIDADTKRFHFENQDGLKVPHIGWNTIENIKENRLFKNVSKDESYYFVHSYFVESSQRESLVASTEYGITFDSSIQKDNIIGVQFHPEKSHDAGLTLLKNFIDLF